jgi:hypothetical protein
VDHDHAEGADRLLGQLRDASFDQPIHANSLPR